MVNNPARTAEEILAAAREMKKGARLPGYTDNKCLLTIGEEEQELVTLLKSGGKFVPDIIPHDGWYNHEVLYGGHQFLAPTIHPREHYSHYVKK